MNKDLDFRSYFGFNSKYTPLTPKLNFINTCDTKQSSINEHISYLLKKTKQQMLIDKKKAEMQKAKNIDHEREILEKMRKLEKKRKMVLKKHQLILSSYNNKMLLDMMLSNKKFLKYLTEKSKIKTETDFASRHDLSISIQNNINSICNTTENSICENITKQLLRLKTLQVNNKTINSEYLSTQNSEIKTYLNKFNYSPNKKNLNDEKYEYKPKKKEYISFPISSTIFQTSIPVKTIKLSQTPKKSFFYLRKKKNENEKNFITIEKEKLMTDINNSYKNKNNNKNKDFKIQKYKSFLNDNKKKYSKNNNINKFNCKSGKNNKNKMCLSKLSLLSRELENNFISSNKRKRPLTCKKLIYKKLV